MAVPPLFWSRCKSILLPSYIATELRPYRTTRLPSSRPSSDTKGCPQWHPAGQLVVIIFFYQRYLTTRLSGYIATRLHDYAKTIEREKSFAIH